MAAYACGSHAWRQGFSARSDAAGCRNLSDQSVDCTRSRQHSVSDFIGAHAVRRLDRLP